jgi:hypothetical protein
MVAGVWALFVGEIISSSARAQFHCAEFDEYIREALETWQVPGLAIAVVKNANIIARCYGVRHLSGEDPVTTETVFPIASCTKSFTAACIAVLVLRVSVVDGQLRIEFGDYSAKLDHWQQDSFYGHAVIEPFLDWLVKFDIDRARFVRRLEIIHVGWKDPDERFVFTRRGTPVGAR